MDCGPEAACTTLLIEITFAFICAYYINMHMHTYTHTKSSMISFAAVARSTKNKGMIVVNLPVGEIPGICCKTNTESGRQLGKNVHDKTQAPKQSKANTNLIPR